MSKIAIVTDSNSGITQTQSKELDVFVLPMPFTINEQEYFEGINLSQEQFYTLLEEGTDVFTSQPSMESVLNMWDEVLKNHDGIVHIPMSSALSSAYQTAALLSEDYEGKVQVVNNQRISVTQRQSVLDAKELAASGKSAVEIKDILEKTKKDTSIYITLNTLKYLKKGGRITPAAAALGTLLKIKPVLQIQGEKLDAFSKARTLRQAKSIMIEAVRSDIDERFGGLAYGLKNIRLEIAYTKDLDMAEEYRKEVEEEFSGYDIHMDPLSLSVSCHIGPGALALACCKRLNV